MVYIKKTLSVATRKLPARAAKTKALHRRAKNLTKLRRRLPFEIRRRYKSATMELEKAEFLQLVREISLEMKKKISFQVQAIEKLQVCPFNF